MEAKERMMKKHLWNQKKSLKTYLGIKNNLQSKQSLLQKQLLKLN
jgi:hypothetical protein